LIIIIDNLYKGLCKTTKILGYRVMKSKINDKYKDYVLEEYRALREESLRSTSIISNTIWISTSTLVVTIGGGITILQEHQNLGSLFLILVSIQSFAGSVMFLSELWKYVRVGYYIRTEIETKFQELSKEEERKSPIHWEHWIEQRRATFYYLISLFVLLSPALIILCLWFLALIDSNSPYDLLKWLIYIKNDSVLFIGILVISGLNLIFACYMLLKIWIMIKNYVNIQSVITNMFRRKN
jgi:hypothetical protein